MSFEDLAPLFADLDIVDVTIDGGTVKAYLDETPNDDLGISGYQPVITCQESDVEAVVAGDSVTYGSTTWTVENIIRETQRGIGVARILMNEADPTAAATWSEVADWTLGIGNDIEYILDIATKIAITGDLSTNISFGVFDARNGWRAQYRKDWIDEVIAGPTDDPDNDKGLTPFARTEITASGLDLDHDIGLDSAGFSTQMLTARAYLEGLIGSKVKTVAYPLHRCDEITFQYLHDQGFLGARDGIPQGYDGVSVNLLGKYDQEDNSKSWEKLLPYSIPIPQYLSSSHLDDLDEAGIVAFLGDTANNQSNPASTLFGSYTSLLDQWKGNNSFVPFYHHNELSEDQVRWLMETIVGDGDFWVASFGEILSWAKLRHKPTEADAFIWEPRTGHAASDYDGKPWNGYKAAFALTTDDGEEENFTEYLGICETLGVNFTAFVMEEGAQHGLSEAQIIALHDSGSCEIGLHGTLEMIRREAATLTHKGTATRIAAELVDESGTRHLKFYKDVS